MSKANTKRSLSESSSVISPEYKRPNLNLITDDLEEELFGDIEEMLLNESPSPKTYIDRNYTDLIKDTIMSEPVLSVIKTLINNEVTERTSKYVEQISFLSGCVDSLTTMVTELRNEVDCQQQFSRRTSLRIVNDWKEERGEDTDQKVVDMAKKCLNLNIQKSDIDRSHRVGKPNIRGRPKACNCQVCFI